MKPTPLILMALMVIFAGFALVRAEGVNEANQTLPYIDSAVLTDFEQNQTWVSVSVRYIGNIPVTFKNEQEMVVYYFNSSIAKSFFGYIPETEMKNIQGGLLALQPSFTAEVTKEGFDKLANDSRVTKIFLDREITAFGNETGQENQTLPYVDPQVTAAFENQAGVDVLVRLVDISNITIEGTKEERRELLNQRDEILNRALDNLLANYSQEEVQVGYILSGTFSGRITKQGFDKLSNDPRVKEIRLEYKGIGHTANDNQNISTPQNNTVRNQTQIKTPEVAKPKSFFQRIINFFKSLFRWK